MLVHVVMPKAEEVAPVAAEAVAAPTATAEPELIKKGKKEEDADAKKDEKKDDKRDDKKK
jgi:hypothetical protein